jgi:FSR family fosmidomycin resistance protein-like MFS transporter
VRRLPIALAVLGHTVVDGSQNVLPVVLPLLLDRFGLSYGQVGFAAALVSVSSSLIQPIFGWVSDRWPTGWFLPAGVAWTGVLMAAVGFVPSYPVLLAAVTLTGVGTAAFHPVASIAVARASGAQRGLGMSFFAAGGNLGFALGPVLGALLVTRFGLPGTAFLVIPGLLVSALIHRQRAQLDTWHPKPEGPAQGSAGAIPWGKLTTLCGLVTLRSWGYSGLIVFIPLLLHTRGAGPQATGHALFVFLFMGALGGMLGGHLSDRLGRQVVITTSLLIFPFLMTGYLLASGWLQWILLAVAGMTLMASFSVTVVFAQELLPDNLGLASGLSLGLAFGAGGVGVALSGLLADALGLATSLWILVALPGIAGLLALTLVQPRARLR